MDEERLSYSGREIIYENLRQKCIYNYDENAWWQYVSQAHYKCYTDFTETCSKDIHQQLGLDYSRTMDCVENSFDEDLNDNALLAEDSIEWVLRGPHFVPAVVINKITYRGTLDPENVFLAICEGFKDSQEECKTHLQIEEIQTVSGKRILYLLAALIFIIMFNIIILLLCRRCSTRDMRNTVDIAINQYMRVRGQDADKG